MPIAPQPDRDMKPATGGCKDDAGRINLPRIGRALLEAILPAHCILCGLHSEGQRLCAPCSLDLPRPGPSCRQCALPVMHSGPGICGACVSEPPAWDHAVTGLLYAYPVDHLVRRFKFHRHFACGQLLADELVLALRRQDLRLPDFLLPVPLHFMRRFQRGYNQAEFLARSVGKALGLPVRVDLMRRTRRTSAQSGLDRPERRKNVRGAFSCPDLAGARVALVDDVLTTGTTLAACARAARKAGAAEVSVWVAARVPSP